MNLSSAANWLCTGKHLLQDATHEDKNSDIVYFFAVLQKYVRSWPEDIVSSQYIQTSKQRAKRLAAQRKCTCLLIKHKLRLNSASKTSTHYCIQ